MIKKEWQSLRKNKILIVVLIAIAAIPFIYAGLFLKSMWDPYGNLKDLPVAVVNNDKAIKYEGRTLSIGNDLTEALKDNDSLDFHFTDSTSARQGLKNGTWYMTITIPEDFSKNASTLLEEQPQKMVLQYATNPGTNYIASKMSETALNQIKDEIASQVTETYTEIVFDRISEAGRGLSEAACGSAELAEGIRTASDGNRTVTDNLKKLSDSTLTFSSGADTLTKGIREYTDGVSRIGEGAVQLKKGTDSLTAKLPGLTGGIHTFQIGLNAYTDGVSTLNRKSPELLAGSKSLKTGAESLSRGLDTLQTGMDRYVSAVNTFTDNTLLYTKGTEKLSDGADKLAPLKELDQVSGGIALLNASVSDGDASLKKGAADLRDGLGSMYSSMQQLSQDISASGNAPEILQQSAGSMQSASTLLSDTAAKAGSAKKTVSELADSSVSAVESCAKEGNKRIRSANQQLGNSRNTMISTAASLEKIYGSLTENDSVSDDTLASLHEVISSLENSSGSIQETAELETENYTAMAREASGAAVSEINDLSSVLSDAADRLDTCSELLAKNSGSVPVISADTFRKLTENAGALYNGAQKLSAGADGVSDALTRLEAQTSGFPEAAKGVEELNKGLHTLLASGQALETGAAELRSAGSGVISGIGGIKSGGLMLSDGVGTLADGICSYTDGVSRLAGNSLSLTSGASGLSHGADTLVSGAGQLSDGTASLAEGTAVLNANSSSLNSGAAMIAEGADQISDGVSRLCGGSEKLGDGIDQLRDGADALSEGLSDGAGETSTLDAGENTFNMFASPVTADETQITEVENNGHAMAPYMMSVGLWVGCLAFCLMYPLTKYNGKLKSGLAWWASKASVLYLTAVLQGLLLIGLLHAVDGFAPAEMVKTVLFACLTAAAFTSVMYFFNITLGKVGSFLMLVFMVVQLSGSAGTYPVEISPAFVSDIHAYLPFTYTVNAFRSTICGGESIRSSVIVLTALTVIFTALTILQFCRMARRRKNGQLLLIDWLEEKGLA